MTEVPENRRRSWLDRQVSVSNIIWLVGLLVGLGMFLQRFDTLEHRVGILESAEALMATKGEVGVVERRLQKKIEILNQVHEKVHAVETELARQEERIRLLHEGGQ